MSSSSSAASPKVKKTGALWEKLRKDLFSEILYSRTPLSGEGKDIFSLVKMYFADYSQLKIPMLKHMLKFIVKKDKQSHSFSMFDTLYSMPVPKLQNYVKQNRGLVEADEGLPRINRHHLMCTIEAKHLKGRDVFIVSILRHYTRQHDDFRLPYSSLDTYFGEPVYELKFKRYAKSINELVEDSKFLYHLRDLILSSCFRVKRKRLCQSVVFKGSNSKKYKVLCGRTIDDNCDECSLCWKKKFDRFVQGI